MVMEYTIESMLNLFERHAPDICHGDLSFAADEPFVGAQSQQAPNGSTVITLNIIEGGINEMSPSHRHIDIFLLEPHRELGAHFHQHATAHVYGIDGCGTAMIGQQCIALGRSDKAIFPAGVVHNVITGESHFLFASFQDHPIIQVDGSLDYFVAE